MILNWLKQGATTAEVASMFGTEPVVAPTSVQAKIILHKPRDPVKDFIGEESAVVNK
jgi:hypothetical protein